MVQETEAASEAVLEAAVSGEEAAVSEEILDLEKCIKLFVLSVARNVKFLLSLQKESLFFARIALERKEDFDFLDAFKSKYFYFILSILIIQTHL